MSRDDLGGLLRPLRDGEAAPPSFDRVWGAAQERREARRPRRRLARAGFAVAVVVALLFVLMPAPESPEDLPAEVLALARSLSEWQAPLDFLLAPPGGGLLGFDPGSMVLPAPVEFSPTQIEEML